MREDGRHGRRSRANRRTRARQDEMREGENARRDDRQRDERLDKRKAFAVAYHAVASCNGRTSVKTVDALGNGELVNSRVEVLKCRSVDRRQVLITRARDTSSGSLD